MEDDTKVVTMEGQANNVMKVKSLVAVDDVTATDGVENTREGEKITDICPQIFDVTTTGGGENSLVLFQHYLYNIAVYVSQLKRPCELFPSLAVCRTSYPCSFTFNLNKLFSENHTIV
jgi:hypothetical protein